MNFIVTVGKNEKVVEDLLNLLDKSGFKDAMDCLHGSLKYMRDGHEVGIYVCETGRRIEYCNIAFLNTYEPYKSLPRFNLVLPATPPKRPSDSDNEW